MSDDLEFTGERFTPECVREIWYEHWHRYALAKSICENKTVLDAASGEGYGSDIISEVARSVIGLDISIKAQKHAKNRYSNTNIGHVNASCASLPFEDDTFEVILSFETLEHLTQQDEMLSEFRRVLKNNGMLLLSSPDKKNYSDKAEFENEFHVKELYKEELVELIDKNFKHHKLLAQKLIFESKIWAIDQQVKKGRIEHNIHSDEKITKSSMPDYEAMYYIACCSDSSEALNEIPALSHFGDKGESVYSHYNEEVRRNMAAGKVLKDYEGIMQRQSDEIKELKKSLIKN